MIRLWSAVLIGSIATAVVAQQATRNHSPNAAIILSAVSRDGSVLVGGISSAELAPQGKVFVEPMGRLTPTGEWIGLPCSSHTPDTADGPKRCIAFEHQYLSKPHVYTVVSARGYGTPIHAASTSLDDCYGYTGTGSYPGMSIRKFAVAASTAQSFEKIAPPHRLGQDANVAVYDALKELVPKKIDTTRELQLFGVRVEGHDIIVIQRAFADVAKTPAEKDHLIFAIGRMGEGKFHILDWKQDEEENQTLLGTIALKNGRQFLITTVSDPEGQWFRVYGIRAGHLVLVYTGGGASC